MDRKKYLTMCEECSRLPKGAMGIPAHVPERLILHYGGADYYPLAYRLSWENGEIRHRAELHDLRANTAVIVNLTELEDNNV